METPESPCEPKFKTTTRPAARIVLQNSVLDPAGKTVTSQRDSAEIPASGLLPISSKLTLAKPQIWDIDHPHLYTLVTEVLLDGKAVDRYTTPFGIRTIAFEKSKGLSAERPRAQAAGRLHAP